MKTSRPAAAFVLGLAAFTAVEWLVFADSLASGPQRPTSGYVLLGVLAAGNVLLAVALGVIGWRAWRS